MKTNIIILLLCMALGHADPNVIDFNDVAGWWEAYQATHDINEPNGVPVEVQPEGEMTVIGIDRTLIKGVFNLSVEVNMYEDGAVYILGDTDIGIYKTRLPKETIWHYATYDVIKKIPAWSKLELGQNSIVASDPNDKWWLLSLDYAGTGRSIGVGIVGKFQQVKVSLGPDLTFEYEYSNADLNHDGIVNMADYAIFSSQWGYESKLRMNAEAIEPVIVEPNEPPMPVVLQTVWVSRTGDKYHLKTCWRWNETYTEKFLFEAQLLGYEPCLGCKPDERTGQ